MTTFKQATSKPIDDAVKQAGESTRMWLDAYVRLMDDAAKGTTTADSLTRDLSTLAACGARDMARAANAWLALGNALLTVDIAPPKPPRKKPAPRRRPATGSS